MKPHGGTHLFAALCLVTLVGCGGDTGDNLPANTVSFEDPRDDTTIEYKDKPSDVTANVDLVGFTATYDKTGLVFEVTYADPLDNPKDSGTDGYGLVINFDYNPKDDSDDRGFEWWSEDRRRVDAFDANGTDYYCRRPSVQPNYPDGRLTFTYPAKCMPKELPKRVRVSNVATYTGNTEDLMFTDAKGDQDVVWVPLG